LVHFGPARLQEREGRRPEAVYIPQELTNVSRYCFKGGFSVYSDDVSTFLFSNLIIHVKSQVMTVASSSMMCKQAEKYVYLLINRKLCKRCKYQHLTLTFEPFENNNMLIVTWTVWGARFKDYFQRVSVSRGRNEVGRSLQLETCCCLESERGIRRLL